MFFKLLDHLPHSIGLVAVRALSRVVLVNVVGTLDEDKNVKGQSNCIEDNSSNTQTSSKGVDTRPSNSCCSSTSASEATNFKDTPDYVKPRINEFVSIIDDLCSLATYIVVEVAARM